MWRSTFTVLKDDLKRIDDILWYLMDISYDIHFKPFHMRNPILAFFGLFVYIITSIRSASTFAAALVAFNLSELFGSSKFFFLGFNLEFTR